MNNGTNTLSTPEQLKEEAKDYVVARLEKIVTTLFLGIDPSNSVLSGSELATISNSELIGHTKNAAYYPEILNEIVGRLETNRMDIEELTTEAERAQFQANPRVECFEFVTSQVANHLTLLAVMKGQKVMNKHTGRHLVIPMEDEIVELIKKMNAAGLIDENKLIRYVLTQQLRDILTKALPGLNWDPTRASINPPTHTTVRPAGAVANGGASSSSGPHSSRRQIRVGGQRNVNPSAATQAFQNPAAMPSQTPTQRPGEPDLNPSAPEPVSNSPTPTPVPLPPPPRAPRDNRAIQFRQNPDSTFPPAAPVLVQEDPEDPESLYMPIIEMLDEKGAPIFTIPFYSTKTPNSDGKMVYTIGTDDRNDFVLPSNGNTPLKSAPHEVEIIIDPLTCEIQVARAKKRVFRIDVEDVNGVNQLKIRPAQSILASAQKVEDGEMLAVSLNDKAPVPTLSDFEALFFSIKSQSSIPKSGMKDYLKIRLDSLLALRKALIAEEGLESNSVKELDKQWEEIVEFNIRHGIDAIDLEQLHAMIEETTSAYEQRVEGVQEKIRAAATEEIEAEAKRRETLRKKAERQQKIQERCQRDGLDGLQILENEDPETIEIVHACPVFTVEGTPVKREGLIRTYPFILSKFSIGGHASNVVELYETLAGPVKKDYAIKDFMAELRHDEVENAFYYRRREGMTRKKHDANFVQLPEYTFPIQKGDVIKVGRYTIKLIGEKQGYSQEALYQNVVQLVDELLERIMNLDRTTGEDDRAAHNEIKTLFQLPIDSNRKRDLALDIQRKYQDSFEKLWNKVCAWNGDEGTPTADAGLFPQLKFLLEVHAEPKTFFPECVVGMANLEAAAWERACRYVDAAEKSVRRRPFAVWAAQEVPFMGKLLKLDGRSKAHIQANGEDHQAANYGAIEIARFMEMGLVDSEAFERLDAPQKYANRIKDTLRARELLQVLRTNPAGQLKAIQELMQMLENMKEYLGHEPKMSDLFGEEEIDIRNLHVELDLTPDKEVIYYIKRIAIFIGRKAYKKLDDKKDPDLLEADLALLEGLMEMEFITSANLGRDDMMETPKTIAARIAATKDRAVLSRRRLVFEKQEEAVRIRQQAETRTAKEQERAGLVQNTEEVFKILFKAQAHKSVDMLAELISISSIMRDPRIAEAMDRFKVKIDAVARELTAVASTRGVGKNPVLADGQAKTEEVSLTWPDIQKEWRQEVFNQAVECALEAIKNGKDAFYVNAVLEAADKKGIFCLRDLGVSKEQLQYGMTVEKMNEYERKAMTLGLEDTSFMEEKFFGSMSDDMERKAFTMTRRQIGWKKVMSLIEKIERGNDPHYDRFYSQALAREILNRDPEIKDYIPADKKALLQ